MRNLKRALSLGLTAAMISGLMVMGSSAASYADVTSEDNQEAIEVLQAVEIMVGDENGDFNPDQNVTRNEMAVIMSNLMEYNVASYKNTSPFTDVPAWAEPYVAACWTNGITAGYSDTIYGGSDTVTTAQAALMLMKALGYFQYASDFGSDWQLATTRQGNAIDLFVGVDSGVTQAMTRNDVAQLVLNTLKSGTVQASTDGSWTIGNVTVNNNVKYNYVTSNQSYATAIDDARSTSSTTDAGRSIVELGEQLYMGELKLNDNTTDVFGRPARYWEYDGNEIGTYAKTELLKKSYTTEVTGKDLYDLLGSSTIKDYKLTVTIDGVSDSSVNGAIFTAADMNKNNKHAVGDTGNGTLTEVYVDIDKHTIDIAIINTYLAIADKDYDEKKEELDVTVYGLDKIDDEYVKTSTTAEDQDGLKIDGGDFDVADVVEDDALLVTVANGEIQSVAAPEIVSDAEITAFKLGSNVTVDGTKYDYADAAEYDWEVLDNYTSTANGSNLKDLTYNVYLDQYGYAIGVDLVETPNNYIFITGVDDSYSNLATKNVDANAIFLDGTMDTIKVNTSKSSGLGGGATVNSWYTYTVNNDGVYTVKKVASLNDNTNNYPGGSNNSTKVAQYADETRDTVIDKKNISLSGGGASSYSRVYGNDATVYLTASIKEIRTGTGRTDIIIDDVDSVTTGVKNANIDPWAIAGTELGKEEKTILSINSTDQSAGVYTLYKSNGYIIASVVVGEDSAASKNLVYVHSSNVEQEGYDKTTDEWTWIRKVISNGQEIELTEVGDSLTYIGNASAGEGKMAQYGWYQVKLNAENEVIGVESVSTTLDKATGNNVALGETGDYVDNVKYLVASINEEDTVLYAQSFTNNNPTMIGSTLYVTSTTTDDNGFFVDENANIALIQWVKNKQETTFYTGSGELEDIVKDLNEKNGKFDYQISAILEDGAATSVVIYDMTNTYQRPSDSVKTGNYDVQRTGYTIDKVLYYYTADHDDDTILDVIISELADEGYTNFKISVNASGDYEIACVDDNGRYTKDVVFTWDPADKTPAVKVKIDNKSLLVANNSDVDDISGWNGPKVKVTFADGTVKYAQGNWKVTYQGTDNWDGAVIETGYYQLGTITVNGPFSATSGWNTQTIVEPVVDADGTRCVKAGDTVKFTIEFNAPTAFDYAEFSKYNFTLPAGSAATSVKAELTTVGTATEEPVVTVTVILGNTLVDGQSITVDTAAIA